jgi:hypothetical protein
MASRDSQELNLEDPEMAEAWLQRLSATARIKKIGDTHSAMNKTDLFLSKAGLQAIRTLSLMAAPRKLEALSFADIEELLRGTIRPKKRLVIAERTRFLTLRQEAGELVMTYYRRLRAAAEHCEFEKLGTKLSKEDELVLMRLIDGLSSTELKRRILERLQDAEQTLEATLQSLQQLEQINSYNAKPAAVEIAHSSQKYNRTQSSSPANCKFCGGSHAKGKCPAFGKKCSNCQKRNHFAAVCRSRRVHHEAGDEEEARVFATTSSNRQSGLYRSTVIS